MTRLDSKRALQTAIDAARAAGGIMRQNFRAPKKINSATQHDIKLELDVRCQKRIERILRAAWPAIAILGEEGVVGDPEAGSRWVVDPIDGTVNFTYGIPHACVSIALQMQTNRQAKPASTPALAAGDFCTLLGVVYDPFCDELWTAVRGQPARLNGQRIRASRRPRLDQAIVAIGFAKEVATLDRMLPTFNQLIHRVRKVRIMGSAALALTYVATGRMDAYVEYGLRLWDIAAGGLIIECAGGDFWSQPLSADYAYQLLASNGRVTPALRKLVATGFASPQPVG
ncbi:MAG TPA: inositol monophosphatase family protein [Verrucomicrobiae bacterium]|nr:inositol monophosphatase family protein [Verrucomicrobiae bacterium]